MTGTAWAAEQSSERRRERVRERGACPSVKLSGRAGRTEVVVDSVNLFLGEGLGESAAELAAGLKVAAEWLFDDDAGVACSLCAGGAGGEQEWVDKRGPATVSLRAEGKSALAPPDLLEAALAAFWATEMKMEGGIER